MCTYSQYFFTELARGVWLWPPVDVLMHLTNGVFVCRIVHIPYTAHITNEEVRHRTSQLSVTSVIAKRRLRLFGHLARADPSQDHSHILRAAVNHPPADWWRRAGQPRRTWLHTIEQSSTFSPISLVSTQRGCVHRIVQSGVSLWRRLCSLIGATWWWWYVPDVISHPGLDSYPGRFSWLGQATYLA